jgi:DNA helicase-2/ATP-dependent DNA helicase PcrA
MERKGRALEEERRLTYVAITRAMKGLYITESEGFNYNTGTKYPSRFLSEIKKNLIVEEGQIDEELFLESQRYISNLNRIIENNVVLFELNETVLHPVFGKGVISLVNIERQEYLIKFDDYEDCKPINMDFKRLQKIVDIK